MRRFVRRLALAAILTAVDPGAMAAQTPEELSRVREIYLAAVEQEAAIPRGLTLIAELRAGGPAAGGSAAAVLSGYEGALVTLRAKHGVWPPARLRHLRDGLEILDAAVVAHPDLAEIRYLRLLSCYFLPGILGRGESVREDFAALARLLPDARDSFPPDLYATMVRFVLERGGVAGEDRIPLEAALRDAGDG